MSSRIQKKIGYFLSPDNTSKLLKSNYLDIIEDLDEKPFFEELNDLGKDIVKNTNNYMLALYLKQLYEFHEQKKVKARDLMNDIYFYDDYVGTLFSTVEMVMAKRSDDLIDYYEPNSMESKITYLKRPIYPTEGYVYHGGLEKYGLNDLEVGKVYLEHLSSIAFKINNLVYNKEYDVKDNVAHILTNDGYFTPCVDEVIYIIAKHAGILKNKVTKEEFEKALEPVILQYWS